MSTKFLEVIIDDELKWICLIETIRPSFICKIATQNCSGGLNKENQKENLPLHSDSRSETLSSSYLATSTALQVPIQNLSVNGMSMEEINYVESVRNRPYFVIVDCDPGTDDAWALLMLIAAEARKEVKILAITCMAGNTSLDQACTNTLRVLQSVDRTDIPVYKGSEKSLIQPMTDIFYHGKNGFGDIEFSTNVDNSLIQSENAVSALNRITSNPVYQGKVSLICLAPLTNIALCMRTFPRMAENVLQLFVMGGNYTGAGNCTSSAEFNFFSDPEAANIVFSSAKHPIILLPWETCLKVPLSMEWRFQIVGATGTRQIQMLNVVERSIFERQKCTDMIACDQMLTAAILRPEIVAKSIHVHMTIELHGHHTRGQVVVDHLKSNQPNVIVITKVKEETFKEMMCTAADFTYTPRE